MQKVAAFKPPTRLLMGLGPMNTASLAARMMSQPLIGYLYPKFIQLMAESEAMLQIVFPSALNTIPG